MLSCCYKQATGRKLSKPCAAPLSLACLQPGSIERVLKLLKIRIAKSREEGFTG
jgi:hypothetical protein